MRRAAAWAVMAAATCAPAAGAQTAVSETYSGTYICGQGETALSLAMTLTKGHGMSAVFYFHSVPSNPGVPSGCFTMHGGFDAASQSWKLTADDWLLRPAGYLTVDLEGRFGSSGFSGRVIGPGCTEFSLQADPHPPALPAACRPAEDNTV